MEACLTGGYVLLLLNFCESSIVCFFNKQLFMFAGVLVVDGLDWNDADIVSRVAKISSTPSSVPFEDTGSTVPTGSKLDPAASNVQGKHPVSNVVSARRVSIRGFGEFGWVADSMVPLTVGFEVGLSTGLHYLFVYFSPCVS